MAQILSSYQLPSLALAALICFGGLSYLTIWKGGTVSVSNGDFSVHFSVGASAEKEKEN